MLKLNWKIKNDYLIDPITSVCSTCLRHIWEELRKWDKESVCVRERKRREMFPDQWEKIVRGWRGRRGVIWNAKALESITCFLNLFSSEVQTLEDEGCREGPLVTLRGLWHPQQKKNVKKSPSSTPGGVNTSIFFPLIPWHFTASDFAIIFHENFQKLK